MSHNIAIKQKDGIYKHFSVDHEVYLYIKQLEGYIKQPIRSKLLENYPERFGDKIMIKLSAPDGSGYSYHNILDHTKKEWDTFWANDRITTEDLNKIIKFFNEA